MLQVVLEWVSVSIVEEVVVVVMEEGDPGKVWVMPERE